MRKLNGTIVQLHERFYWLVKTDATENHLKEMFITMPHAYPGAQVGDEVELEYRTSAASGLWYATKKTSKLSPHMREALEKVKMYGALERWPGGFWTYPDCQVSKHSSQVPEWSVGWSTVKALLERGLLREGSHQQRRDGTSFIVEVLP